MAGRRREYRFVINAFTPRTLPMARLAEYMADLAKMVGAKDYVHFIRLEAGSTVLVHAVEWEAEPKVRDRLLKVKRREAPPDAMQAFASLDKRLEEDNATGCLVEPTGKNVIKFPGRQQAALPSYGPFNQPGQLDGVLNRVGGAGDPVPVHLQDGETTHICEASRAVARELAHHLFASKLRVSGTGRWVREEDGSWAMIRFTITAFEVLDDRTLAEVVEELRNVEAEWKRHADPLKELLDLRKGHGT